MSLLGWHLRRWGRALGLPGAVALLLLGALALQWAGVERPRAAALEALREDVARLDAKLRTLPSGERTLPIGQSALEAFEARFADERRITTVVARMQVIAARSGVAIDRADFKLERNAGEPLQRYVMQLAMKADYRALRRFARDLLREQGAIALDDIALRREDPKLPAVDAQLRLVLFVTPTPSGN